MDKKKIKRIKKVVNKKGYNIIGIKEFPGDSTFFYLKKKR
jgi:hypothetical protein